MVAEEYYIPSRHPTCDNFRAASKMFVAAWLNHIPEGASICEVGAGKSVVAEHLIEIGVPLSHLLITDQSARMLKYSTQFCQFGASLKEADATHLPLGAESVDYLISSLGDPYNVREFWVEVARVLGSAGKAIFTTPAYTWAKHFRVNGAQAFKEAEFELIDGSRVLLPSFIYSDCEQQNMIRAVGLNIVATHNILIRNLEGERLSHKLGLDRGPDGEVVSGYLIEKS